MYMKDSDIADYIESIAQVLRDLNMCTTHEGLVREAHGAADALFALAKDVREG